MQTRPRGFQLASGLPIKPSKLKPIKAPVLVSSLREAIEAFKYNVDATQLDDINLEGARVAALFRRDEDGMTFLVMYKREFYKRFGRHFDIPAEDKGYGVLANHKIIYWAALNGHHLAAVFPDGRCYTCSALDFLRYHETYNTECLKLPGEIAYPLKKFERI